MQSEAVGYALDEPGCELAVQVNAVVAEGVRVVPRSLQMDEMVDFERRQVSPESANDGERRRPTRLGGLRRRRNAQQSHLAGVSSGDWPQQGRVKSARAAREQRQTDDLGGLDALAPAFPRRRPYSAPEASAEHGAGSIESDYGVAVLREPAYASFAVLGLPHLEHLKAADTVNTRSTASASLVSYVKTLEEQPGSPHPKARFLILAGKPTPPPRPPLASPDAH